MDLSKRNMWIIAGVIAALVLAGAAFALTRDGDDAGAPGSDLASEPTTGAVAGAEDTLTADGTTKQAGPQGASGDAAGSGSGGSSGSGASGSGGDQGSGGQTPGGGTESGFVARIMWWNDTVERAPRGFKLEIEDDSWSANAAKKSEATSLGPLPYEKKLILVIYPDGPSGKKISVPVRFAEFMEPDSRQDAIHVEVSDARVRVLGNPVDKFDQQFERF